MRPLPRHLHIVVNAPGECAAKEREGPVIRIEHHLLPLSHVVSGKQHPPVAQLEMGDLHGHCHAADQHDLVAPVQSVCLARRIIDWHIGICRGGCAGVRLSLGIPSDSILAARIDNAKAQCPERDAIDLNVVADFCSSSMQGAIVIAKMQQDSKVIAQ
jgi:hypothetical protein